jgi:hypothetical protein
MAAEAMAGDSNDAIGHLSELSLADAEQLLEEVLDGLEGVYPSDGHSIDALALPAGGIGTSGSVRPSVCSSV